MPLEEVLWHCFRQNYHADQSNAAIHTSVVRYSPLTFRLAEWLWASAPSYHVNEMLRGVVLDLGAYDEDVGR